MADDRGRGDDKHGDGDDETGADRSPDDSGDQGDEREQGDVTGPPDAPEPGRTPAPGESPSGLPLNRPGSGSPGSGSGPAGFGAGFGGGGGFPGLPDLGGVDPSDLGAMLEKVLGEAASNPELAEAMRSMGVDPTDPTTQAAMRAQ